MGIWLASATQLLNDNIRNQPAKSFLKNILCIVMIYFKIDMLKDFCHNSKYTAIIGSFLRNLAVDASSVFKSETQKFWNYYGHQFLQALVNFINNIINFHPSLTEWIFAIPMVHILMGQHCTLNSIGWNENPSNFKYACVLV